MSGSLAWRDGRLRVGDFLTKVGSIKVRNSEEAAREIGRVKNEPQISLTITRTAKMRNSEDSERPHLVIPEPNSVRQTPTIPSKIREKCIVVRKEPGESLGLGIAGGLGSLLGDLPVFVLEVSQRGVLSRDGRIKAGDLIISINGKSVSGLRHNQVWDHFSKCSKAIFHFRREISNWAGSLLKMTLHFPTRKNTNLEKY